MPDPQDQGTSMEGVTILLPGDEPTGTQGTVTPPAGASPAEGTDDMAHVYEAAGLKPPDPKPAPPTPLDPQLLETLKNLDPTQLPDDLQERFDKKFHAAFTRKTQSLAEKERAIEQRTSQLFDRMERALTKVGTPTEGPGTRNELADLRERIRNGDVDAYDAFEKLVDEKVQQKVGPLESSAKIREAYDLAEAQEPLLKENAEDVGALIRNNPDVVSMLTVENHKFAPMVFQQLAINVAYAKLRAQAETWEARTREIVEKAVRADRARVASLPQTTTHAATSSGTPPAPATPKTWDEARAKLFADLKGMGVG